MSFGVDCLSAPPDTHQIPESLVRHPPEVVWVTAVNPTTPRCLLPFSPAPQARLPPGFRFQDQEQIILPIDVAPGAPLMRLTRASEVVPRHATMRRKKQLWREWVI